MRSLGGLMKKANVTIYYGLIMAIYSIGFVTMSAFSSVFLLNAGLSNGGVGILLALGAVILWFAAEEVKDIERKK